MYTPHVPQEGRTPSHFTRLRHISQISVSNESRTHLRLQFSQALLTLLRRLFPATCFAPPALGPGSEGVFIVPMADGMMLLRRDE